MASTPSRASFFREQFPIDLDAMQKLDEQGRATLVASINKVATVNISEVLQKLCLDLKPFQLEFIYRQQGVDEKAKYAAITALKQIIEQPLQALDQDLSRRINETRGLFEKLQQRFNESNEEMGTLEQASEINQKRTAEMEQCLVEMNASLERRMANIKDLSQRAGQLREKITSRQQEVKSLEQKITKLERLKGSLEFFGKNYVDGVMIVSGVSIAAGGIAIASGQWMWAIAAIMIPAGSVISLGSLGRCCIRHMRK
jgi:uncharacterized protein (DUF3084 family)